MTEVGFEDCFRQHFARLVALAGAMTADVEAGHDIAQEAFVRLHRKWDDLADHHQLGGWLTRVVSNLAIDHHRARQSRDRAVVNLSAISPSGGTGSESNHSRWSELIAPLPPRQRAIVTLHYGEDRPVAEIAEMLGVSVNTVKSALSKARDTLRQLGDQHEH